MSIENEFNFVPFHISYLKDELDSLVNSRNDLSTEADFLVKERIPNFYTIGMTTYKDGYTNLDREKVAISNSVLRSIFRPLYDFQLYFFEDILKEKVKYMAGMPLPGFHYFKYCEDFTFPLARPHVDVPFNKYDWGSKVEQGSIFSCLIPINLPKEAGMYAWDLTASDMAARGAEAVISEARDTIPPHFIPHKVDRACIHSGKRVHMIKPFEIDDEGSTRVTMQSHAVFLDGCWQLYW